MAHQRLAANSLSVGEILGVSLADTAPVMGFFFPFAAIATAAGVASPSAIVMAATAILRKLNSLSEFTEAIPSAGSCISWPSPRQVDTCYRRKANILGLPPVSWVMRPRKAEVRCQLGPA